MKKEVIFLFIINVFSAIGYSLIAPLYPALAEERGLGEDICGLVISMFAVSDFLFTPFCPAIIQKVGRKKIFYLAMILEVINIYFI
jgi:MFS family permease